MQPVFNVTKFQGVTNVQMNDAMVGSLQNLIGEVDLQPAERHLMALRAALLHPEGSVRPERSERSHARRDRHPNTDNGFGDGDNYQYGS